jgi:hypothetical protein
VIEAEVVTVPVVARVVGLDGTLWRSDLSLTNAEDVPIDIKLRFQPSRDTVLSRKFSLDAFQTLLLEDPIKNVFDVGGGRGPIRVETLTGYVVEPAVVSRTIAERDFGNFGQGMPAVVRPGSGTSYVTGLRHDDRYRSNVAVTAADNDVTATFALFRAAKGLVASGVERIVRAGQQKQWSIEELFPGMALPDEPMTVVMGLSDCGVAYASVVDNGSTDAVTYLGEKPGYDWIVPAVAHSPGERGTFWTSDVAIINTSTVNADLTFEYLPENTDNSDGGLFHDDLRLRPQHTVLLRDVADTIFGVRNGKGVLRVRSNARIVVTSRIYTDERMGTIGHGLRTVSDDALTLDTKVLTGVRMKKGFRSNVGVVSGEAPASVRLQLRDQNGVLRAEKYREVPPRSMRQWSVDKLFGVAASKELDPVGSVVVEADADFFAYLVTIDNSSQDPVMLVPDR